MYKLFINLILSFICGLLHTRTGSFTPIMRDNVWACGGKWAETAVFGRFCINKWIETDFLSQCCAERWRSVANIAIYSLSDRFLPVSRLVHLPYWTNNTHFLSTMLFWTPHLRQDSKIATFYSNLARMVAYVHTLLWPFHHSSCFIARKAEFLELPT